MSYNYVKQSDMDKGEVMTEMVLKEGIERFQRFANITITGMSFISDLKARSLLVPTVLSQAPSVDCRRPP